MVQEVLLAVERIPGWGDEILARRDALQAHEARFGGAWLLATVKDIRLASDSPRTLDCAMKFLMGRLKLGRPPSDLHYDEAKARLRAEMDKSKGDEL